MDVNDIVRIKVEQAAAAIAAARRRREELGAARQHGIARRHAARLRNLADRQADDQTPKTNDPEAQAS